MRTVKEPEERRNEILDNAEELFMSNGYSKTTVADIIDKVGIAKGTFYYYFDSKEEVMESVLMRITMMDIEKAKQVVKDDTLTSTEKIAGVLMAQKPTSNEKKHKMLDYLHLPENIEMHHKSLEQSIKYLVPILETVVEQGIKEGIMNTYYPKENMEMILTSAAFMFDSDLFENNEDEVMNRIYAFVQAIEKMLGMKKRSMEFLIEVMLS